MSETFEGTQQVAPAGWYPDPGAAEQHRWWDGAQWTAHTSAPQPVPTYAAASYSATTHAAPTAGAWWRNQWVISGGVLAVVVAAVVAAVAKAGVHPIDFKVIRAVTQSSSAISAQVYDDETESNGESLVASLPALKASTGWQVCHALEPGGNWLGVAQPYPNG